MWYYDKKKAECPIILKLPKSLEILKISSYDAENVSFSEIFFTNLQFIRLLRLKFSNFSNVPNDAFNSLKNLEVLEIGYPKNFSHIELKDLFKLKWLRLDLNESEIPIFDKINPDLQVFDFCLRNNEPKLEAKSKIFQIFNFRKLKAFSFFIYYKIFNFDLDWLRGKNSSEHFEQEFNDGLTTSSLRYLYLNGLESLEGRLSSFENLQTLKLHLDSEFKFQPGMLNGLANLKSLDISQSSLNYEILASGLFNGLVNLERLNMFHCGLKRLPAGLFSPLVRLQVLDLKCNKSLIIRDKTLKALKNLKVLKIDITEYVSLRVLYSLKSLEQLILNYVSEKLIEKIKKIFPNIEIRHDYIQSQFTHIF